MSERDDLDTDDLSAWTEAGPGGSVILRLEYPFELRVRTGRDETVETVDELVFNRPKAGDLDQMGSSPKAIRAFIALLLVDKRLDERKLARDLDATDFFRATEVATGFLPKKRKDSNVGVSPLD